MRTLLVRILATTATQSQNPTHPPFSWVNFTHLCLTYRVETCSELSFLGPRWLLFHPYLHLLRPSKTRPFAEKDKSANPHRAGAITAFRWRSFAPTVPKSDSRGLTC